VDVSWSSVNGATSYEVVRSANGTTFTTVTTTSSTSISDSSVAANTAYLYKVRVAAGTYSAPDLATTVMFTEDPLSAGMIAKSSHVTQLRSAVNAVRTLAGIGTATFTGGTTILASHINELRSRLDEARSALSLAPVSYTDPSITAGSTVIKAAHIIDLRNGVK